MTALLTHPIDIPFYSYDKKFINKYKVIAENSNPRKESLDAVDTILRSIKSSELKNKDWPLGYAIGHRRRIAFDSDLLRGYVSKQDKIIDIGSLPLLFPAAFKKFGYNITCLDRAPERLQDIIDYFGLGVIKCDVETEQIPFEDDYFDAVILHEVFEHLRINLIYTMKEILRILKPNGRLFLSTPNLKSINGLINFLHHDIAYSCVHDIYTEYNKLNSGHVGHVREYTTKEVCTFLEKVGFNIEKIIFRGAGSMKCGPRRCLAKVFPHLAPFFSIIGTPRE